MARISIPRLAKWKIKGAEGQEMREGAAFPLLTLTLLQRASSE
jgi:hypothetical protein